jgi:amidohydrolase
MKICTIVILGLSIILSALHGSHAQTATNKQIQVLVDKEFESLAKLYKHLHAHPELSFQENQTSALLADELKKLGYAVTTNVGGYGVVGVLQNGPGPVVMVRTDMDGLPIKEHTQVGFASSTKMKDGSGEEVDVMHACGHDMHMAVWTGVARVIAQRKKDWKGTVVFIGQPAEEKGAGARLMIADGLFTKFPRPDYALALHVNSALESGKVGICPGYVLANIDVADIIIKGKGGHGAVPQLTIDPIVMASRIITGFQTIVSREIAPQAPALITVGSIHGGTNANTIPDEVRLEVSIRSFDEQVQKQLIEKIKKTCEGVALASGLEKKNYPIVTIRDEFSPAVYNDPVLSEKISAHWSTVLGKENVVTLGPEMFGEDFGWYGREKPAIPTLIYSLGSVNPEKMAEAKKSGTMIPSTHSSFYIPDLEPGLKLGVTSMSSAVLYLLAQPR